MKLEYKLNFNVIMDIEITVWNNKSEVFKSEDLELKDILCFLRYFGEITIKRI